MSENSWRNKFYFFSCLDQVETSNKFLKSPYEYGHTQYELADQCYMNLVWTFFTFFMFIICFRLLYLEVSRYISEKSSLMNLDESFGSS